MALDSTIAGALEARRQQLAALESVQGGVFENSFVIPVTASGDVIAQVDFTVRFVERPIMLPPTFAMRPNQRLIAGNFPKVHGGVFVWKMGRRWVSGAQFYDGATLALTVEGPDDLHADIDVVFRGRAVRDPAGR